MHHKTLQYVSIEAVESFFEIYEVDIARGIPFDELFDDYLKGGYLVSTRTVFSETCLLIFYHSITSCL